MNRFYNHIEHFVNSNDEGKITIRHRRQVDKRKANQLDGKQHHTGFDYHEYDMPKCGTLIWAQSTLDWSRLNFQEHLTDPEHDQARRQGMYSHGEAETC